MKEDKTKPNPNWISAPYRAVRWTPEKGFEEITEPPPVRESDNTPLPPVNYGCFIDSEPMRFKFDGETFRKV